MFSASNHGMMYIIYRYMYDITSCMFIAGYHGNMYMIYYIQVYV